MIILKDKKAEEAMCPLLLQFSCVLLVFLDYSVISPILADIYNAHDKQPFLLDHPLHLFCHSEM